MQNSIPSCSSTSFSSASSGLFSTADTKLQCDGLEQDKQLLPPPEQKRASSQHVPFGTSPALNIFHLQPSSESNKMFPNSTQPLHTVPESSPLQMHSAAAPESEPSSRDREETGTLPGHYLVNETRSTGRLSKTPFSFLSSLKGNKSPIKKFRFPGVSLSRDILPSLEPIRMTEESVSSNVAAATDSAKASPSIGKEPQSSSNENRKLCHNIADLTAIVCRNIPPEYNNKIELLRLFSRYKGLKKIISCPKQQQAVIKFDSHSAAEQVKKNILKLAPQFKQVSIFWVQESSKKVKESERKSSDNSDVNAELKSMLEASEDHKILDRPLETLPKQQPERKAEKPKTKTSPLKLLKQKTSTHEDCFKVLDIRDRLLRSNLKKQSTSAKHLFGTCWDMCPEKERYGRYTKKGLSVFEHKNFDPKSSSLEHQLIVKEYSRSSADQEEPLPHELRPAATLQMTMSYLLCNIVDNMISDSTSIGEWYDFIWNRTRAIRKDITQQRLCDISSVNIVEKCARFHVHCAAALCDEDVATFDPKINDENLTKCLQTLKHLYQDLAEKQVHCSNEPEFRAYDILLSLKEGDALRHVQHLHVDVRNTPEVEFAVSAALAFSSNNYVRFFKLVAETSYLNACILQRYFREVRLQAVQILLKAFCAPNRTEQYPVENLCSTLKFGDIAEATEFCKLLGFRVENQIILLDRLAFAVPVLPIGPNRSVIVQRKQRLAISEIINNGSLPENPLHSYVPHSSFNSKGYLKADAYQALDQQKKAPVAPCDTASESSHHPVPSLQARSATADEDMLDLTTKTAVDQAPKASDSLTASTSVGRKMPLSSTSISPAKFKTEETFKIQYTIPMKRGVGEMPEKTPILPSPLSADEKISEKPVVTEVTETFLKQIKKAIKEGTTLNLQKSDVHPDAKKVELRSTLHKESILSEPPQDKTCLSTHDAFQDKEVSQYKKEQQWKVKEKATEQVVDSLISEVVQEEVTDIVGKVNESLKKKLVQDICCLLSEDILSECIEEESVTIASEVYTAKKSEWMDSVKQAQHSVHVIRMRKALLLWHRKTINRRRLEMCRNLFPSCPPLVQASTKTSLLTTENPSAYFTRSKHITRLLDAGVLHQTLKEELAWKPYDLGPLFESCCRSGLCLPKLAPRTYFWKLVLVYEESTEKCSYSLLMDWLRSKFSKGYLKQDRSINCPIHSLYWLTNIMGDRIAICVRSIAVSSCSQSTLHEIGNLPIEGTCSVLLCIRSTSSEQNQTSSDSILSSVDRLLKAKRAIPPVSLHCFVVHEGEPSSVQAQRYFTTLKEQNLIHEFELSDLDVSLGIYALDKQVHEAVEWLIQHCPQFPDLATENYRDFLQDSIVAVFNVIYQDLSHKKNQNITFQSPQCIIEFFNAVMKHRASILKPKSLESLSWPLPEVTADILGEDCFPQSISEDQLKVSCALEKLQLPPFFKDPTNLENAFLYVQKVMSSVGKSPFPLIPRILHLLFKTPPHGMEGVPPEIPWADVLYECANFLASCSSLFEFSDKDDIRICYTKEDMNAYDSSSEWQKIQLRHIKTPKRKRLSEPASYEGTQKRAREQVSMVLEPPRSQHPLESSLQLGKSEDSPLSDLQDRLAVEKMETEAFMHKLQQFSSPQPTPSQYSCDSRRRNSDVFYQNLASEPRMLGSQDLNSQLLSLKNRIEIEEKEGKLFSAKLKAILS